MPCWARLFVRDCVKIDGLQSYPSDHKKRQIAGFAPLLMSAINIILSTNENDIIANSGKLELLHFSFSSLHWFILRKIWSPGSSTKCWKVMNLGNQSLWASKMSFYGKVAYPLQKANYNPTTAFAFQQRLALQEVPLTNSLEAIMENVQSFNTSPPIMYLEDL